MTERFVEPLEGLKQGSEKILSKETAVNYSFEYVYRLLLVYFFTKKGTVEAIKEDDRSAFDGFCVDALKEVLKAIAIDKDINVGDELEKRLALDASKTLIAYVKSSMKGDPKVIARNLASSFDETLKEQGLWQVAMPYSHVYREE